MHPKHGPSDMHVCVCLLCKFVCVVCEIYIHLNYEGVVMSSSKFYVHIPKHISQYAFLQKSLTICIFIICKNKYSVRSMEVFDLV